MRKIQLTCILVVLCALSSHTLAEDPNPIDQTFITTFADNFKFLSSKTVVDEFDRGWRVIAAQPLHTGIFCVRYEADVNPERDLQKRTAVRFEFLFDIGDTGTSRLIDLQNGTRVAFPTACVGDTLLFPIVIGPHISNGKLFHHATEERVEKIYAKYFAEMRQTFPPTTQPATDDHFENKLADHFMLNKLSRNSARTESGTSMHESTIAIFQAAHAGEFDIQLRIDNQSQTQNMLSLRIVKETDPLTVTLLYANQYDFYKVGSGETVSQPLSYKPPGTLTIREGDRILLPIYRNRVNLPQAKPTTLPTLRVEESPLKFIKGPFE